MSISLESNYRIFLVDEESSDIFAAFSLVSIGEGEGASIDLTNGLIDRFQLIKYLRPRSVSDVVDPDTTKLPTSLKLVFDVESLHLKNKGLISICKDKPKTLGRLEMGSLSTTSLDIKVLPGTRMAISLNMKVSGSPAFNYIPNKIKDSNYNCLEFWGLVEEEIDLAYPEPTEFY